MPNELKERIVTALEELETHLLARRDTERKQHFHGLASDYALRARQVRQLIYEVRECST